MLLADCACLSTSPKVLKCVPVGRAWVRACVGTDRAGTELLQHGEAERGAVGSIHLARLAKPGHCLPIHPPERRRVARAIGL